MPAHLYFVFALCCTTASSLQLNPVDGPCGSSSNDIKSNFKHFAQLAYHSIADTVLANMTDVAVGLSCLSLLASVTNDPLRGPWLVETQAPEAIMDFMTKHKHNKEVQYKLCFLIGGGYPVSEAVITKISALGGFEHLFEQITINSKDPVFQKQIYRALSGPAYTIGGATIIANHGGPLKGIDFLVNQMQIHPEPHLAASPQDHFSLKSEIMQVSAGIMSQDTFPFKIFANRFLQDNFLDQIIHSMQVESDLRGTCDVGCKCTAMLTSWSPVVSQKLIEKNGVALLQNATMKFHDMGRSSIGFRSGIIGEEYPVVPHCLDTLANLVQSGGERVKEDMKKLGFDKTLASVRPEFTKKAVIIRKQFAWPW